MDVLQAAAPYVTGLTAALLVWAFFKRSGRHTLPYPPGPKPLPLIGNLLDFPTKQEWLIYRRWNEQYGEIVYTEALGRKTIFLGSADAVNDLLERKGTIYSDRPHMAMTHDLMDCRWILALMPYGGRWRKGRKLLHNYLHIGAASSFNPVQITAARRLVVDLLSKQERPSSGTLSTAVRLNVGQTIIKIVYGIDVKDIGSEFISLPEQLNGFLRESVMPGRFLVDLVPAIRHVPAWMPGAEFRKFGREATAVSRRIRDAPVTVIKASIADGTASSSIVRSMLEEMPSYETRTSLGPEGDEDNVEELIKDIGAMAYLAGADTTASTIMSFFLAMLVYPEVQSKAQAEIDRVIGRERLPEMEDLESLPYVSAVVAESLRWLPVVPMGVPHMTSSDDEYKGYFIPKGTVIIGSAWAILHNSKDYPDPHAFDPERYLIVTPSGAYASNPDAPDPRTASFGFGRRVCVGRHLADASLFATVSTVLATMGIIRAKDAQGKETVPEVAQTSGFISHPKPFSYALECRSAKSRALLAATMDYTES